MTALIKLVDQRPRVVALEPAVRWVLAHRVALVVASATVAAALVRLVAISGVPAGALVDEAWTGIDARRVLTDGWIGPYVEGAQGQPSGPLYWAAPVVAVLGDGIAPARTAMALLGIATIPVAYLAYREMTDRRTALLGTVLLTFLTWHVHLSRLAFPVISWPLIELAAVYLMFRSFRTRSVLTWGAAGAVAGLGIYTYNTYPLFGAALAAAVLVRLALEAEDRVRANVLGVALAALAGLVVAMPMIVYAADPANDYFEHHRKQWVFSHADRVPGAAASASDVELVRARAKSYAKGLVMETEHDSVDGLGTQALFEPATLILGAAGIAIAARRWRRSTLVLVALMAVVLSLGAILTIDGAYRRTFGLAPLVALLVAAPLAEAWTWSERRAQWLRVAAPCAVVVTIALFVASNVRSYRAIAGSEWMQWLYDPQLRAASEYMGSLEGQPYVYFYDERTFYRNEVTRYLAPRLSGEDRSLEFDRFAALYAPSGHPNIVPRHAGDALYVLLGRYVDQELSDIQQAYPGGMLVEQRDDAGRVMYAAYRVNLPPAVAPQN